MHADNPDRFIHLEWHFTQALSTSDAVARRTYYETTGSPTVVFDGVNPVVGFAAGTTTQAYENAFAARQAIGSQLSVSAEVGFDESSRSGAVTVTVTVATGETIVDVSETYVRCAIYEDDYFLRATTWQGVGRALVLDVPLTVSASGAVQTETATFDLVDPSPPGTVAPWGPADKFRAIAFVQRDDDREILNAAPAVSSPMSVTPTSWGKIKAGYRR